MIYTWYRLQTLFKKEKEYDNISEKETKNIAEG